MNSATDIHDLTKFSSGVASTDRFSRAGRSRAFYELVKPRMNLLILGTTMVGYTLAAQWGPDWRRLPHTLLGTALCAAGAAILNQLIEIHHDALMPRTARRPLVTGIIAPAEALGLGLAAGILGGLDLWYFVNPLTALLGVGTLASYVLIYTPLKRATTLNTIVGAVPGAIPPMMGWVAVTGSLSKEAWALFLILFVWQIPHFLAIATMYREDYRLGGFKMLPVNDPYLSATSRQILLYSAALFPASLAPVLVGLAGTFYCGSAVILSSVFMAFAVASAIQRTRKSARSLFFISIIYLPVLLTILILNRL